MSRYCVEYEAQFVIYSLPRNLNTDLHYLEAMHCLLYKDHFNLYLIYVLHVNLLMVQR